MRAVTIEPGKRDSLALEHIDEVSSDGSVLVQTLAIGVCGTDRELIEGALGAAPAGRKRLILGHESLGRVMDAPRDSGFAPGDTVVAIVRHPDPVPCASCAVGEWDMCRNGQYSERGIKEADGFCVERWRAEPGFLIKTSARLGLAGVLLEPASILAKAWGHIERISRRSSVTSKVVLVTGAGPVGLMAAMIGMQRGLDVHVMDHNESGIKPELVRALGARYHTAFPAFAPDLVIECTGVPAVVAQALVSSAPGGIVCLAGLGGAPHAESLDVATLNDAMVLGNRVVFGTVNANLRHYAAAAAALERAERGWLERILTRRVALQDWRAAYEKRRGDVKTVLLFED